MIASIQVSSQIINISLEKCCRGINAAGFNQHVARKQTGSDVIFKRTDCIESTRQKKKRASLKLQVLDGVLRFAVERPSCLDKCSLKRNTGPFLGILMKPSFVCSGADSSKVCAAQTSVSCLTESHRAEEEARQRVTAHQRWPSARAAKHKPPRATPPRTNRSREIDADESAWTDTDTPG